MDNFSPRHLLCFIKKLYQRERFSYITGSSPPPNIYTLRGSGCVLPSTTLVFYEVSFLVNCHV